MGVSEPGRNLNFIFWASQLISGEELLTMQDDNTVTTVNGQGGQKNKGYDHLFDHMFVLKKETVLMWIIN
jgi:hypothetical protein